MRRVFVHIGTHKTGTTAFQQYMARAVIPGVSYFSAQEPEQHALPLLAVRRELTLPIRSKYPDWTLDECLTSVRSAVDEFLAAQNETTWFSNEALSLVRTTEEAVRLRDVVGDATIVVSLRDPESFLASWRSQLQKMGLASSSPYKTSLMNTEPDSWLVDYDRLISTYEKVFSCVRTVRYEEAMERNGSIIPALLAVSGVNDLPDGWSRQSNVSGGPVATKRRVARAFKRRLAGAVSALR